MNFHLAHPRSQLATMSGVTHSRATPLRLRVRRRQSNAERSNRNNSSASAPGDGDADGFLWSQVKTVIIISYPTERPCDGRGLRGLDGDLPQVKSARCSAPMSLPGPYDAVVCGTKVEEIHTGCLMLVYPMGGVAEEAICASTLVGTKRVDHLTLLLTN
ncbi:uncharacterized protein LOC107303838 isoform X2 [Oryza brachyantha]|uniref:uncharacterized protein LOC107303838 isoform X2 n=1 Tax=Oryza brachyantha TaxID=4533 RepID=UPI0007760DAA|nr:uncharacterized protein LOC107303838 isoform X2 [Oryza brachyantha]